MEIETTDSLFHFYAWLHSNWKRVTAGATVVLVIAAAVSLYSWHSNQQETEAGEALLNFPTLSDPGGVQDTSHQTALAKIIEDYPSTVAGTCAQLLAAKSLFVQGKYAQAEQEFSRFATDHSGSDLAPMAQVGQAACLEAEGKLPEAMAKYKEVAAAHGSEANIAVPLKLTLGRLSEAANKPEAAFNYYKEVASLNNPNDPWVVEAMQRLRLLVTSHPELMPAAQNPAVSAPPAASGLLNPSAAETEISPPSAASENSPKPAQAQKPAVDLPPIQIPTNLGPVTKP